MAAPRFKLPEIKIRNTDKNRNTHSIRFKALKINLPMLSPTGRVTPGARNFSQASMKLMELTKPAQNKRTAIVANTSLFILKQFYELRNKLGFHFDGLWKQDVVFQVDMFMEIVLKILEILERDTIICASIFGDGVIFCQFGNLSQSAYFI